MQFPLDFQCLHIGINRSHSFPLRIDEMQFKWHQTESLESEFNKIGLVSLLHTNNYNIVVKGYKSTSTILIDETWVKTLTTKLAIIFIRFSKEYIFYPFCISSLHIWQSPSLRARRENGIDDYSFSSEKCRVKSQFI